MLWPLFFISPYKNYRRGIYLAKRAGPAIKGLWNSAWRYSNAALIRLDRSAGLIDDVNNASPTSTCIIKIVWPPEED